jgi:hypothetical protein
MVRARRSGGRTGRGRRPRGAAPARTPSTSVEAPPKPATRPAPAEPAAVAAPTSGDAALDAAFAPGAKILAGFDAPAADGAWRVGDAALFGVVFREDGRASTRFVRYVVRGRSAADGVASRPGPDPAVGLPAVDPQARQARLFARAGAERPAELTEPSLALDAEVFDARGERVVDGPAFARVSTAALVADLPAAYAAVGGTRALKIEFDNKKTDAGRRREFVYGVAPADGAPADAARDAALLGVGSTFLGLVDTFRHYGALRDFRRRLGDVVVDAPSALGAVFGIAGELALARPPADAAPAVFAPAALFPAAPTTFDAVFRLNGDPALLMRFVAVPPVAPYHLAGGVLAFEGRHPEHAGRSVAVRLLAARRGAP